MKRAIWLLALMLTPGCGESSPPAVPPARAAEPLPMQELGSFDYKEKMKLPESVTKWNGRRVRATGYVNPPMGSPRELTRFLLVKDLGSCCFGKSPQLNHYVEVKLKPGQTVNYSRDPVSVDGVIQVEERFDGDWPLGLYWMQDAEVAK